MSPEFKFSPEQTSALGKIEAFLAAPRGTGPQTFCMQGLAGTGKSVLLAELGKRHRNALLCAPTGKAASVLARRTGLETKTLHSAIYLFRGEYVADSGEKYLSFKAKINDGDWRRKIALVDESGMVDQNLGADLLATGCKVVATGDPGQLPPVRGTRFFDRADFTLREVHRQALDSAVLRQAHAVRATGNYAPDGPDFQVTRNVSRDDILAADIILCWRNVTRHALNALVRAHKGLDGPPIAGEPVMCLRNDHELGVLNGAQYELLRDYDVARRGAAIVNERGETIEIEDCRFETIDPPGDPADSSSEHPFAFSYACTVHKAQGSEWSRGILVDEYDRHEHRREWVYCALTRFSKQLLVYNTWG